MIKKIFNILKNKWLPNKIESICLQDLFFVYEYDDIKEFRKHMLCSDITWMKENPEIVSLENFKIRKKNSRYSINNENVIFECLYIDNNSKNLVISLGGGGRENKKYPMFHRWKYAKFFNANIFCVDDPMYGLSEYTVVKWYYGDKNVSYLKLLVPIILKVIKQLNINTKNVTFIGSSGGGMRLFILPI